MKTSGLLGRISSRVVGVLTSIFVVGGFGVLPAYADYWQLQDGFEYNPSSTWTLYHSGNGSGGFDIKAGRSRSGYNNAWLTVLTGWSSVGRTVVFSPYFSGRTLNCNAQIYIQPLIGSSKLNFEVIDPSTWRYVALKTVTVTGGSYQAVLVGPFIPARKDLFVRVSLLGNGTASAARVDDLTVGCQYY
ncbi:MAG TPA: hypothetical protein DDZ80_11710 [Cyanobacteria bacterium UBA8803]|nr:hypothetical protein [Cyanobacteria bacterium UBA8803]